MEDEGQADSYLKLQEELGFSTTEQQVFRDKITEEIENELKETQEKKRKALERKNELQEKKKKIIEKKTGNQLSIEAEFVAAPQLTEPTEAIDNTEDVEIEEIFSESNSCDAASEVAETDESDQMDTPLVSEGSVYEPSDLEDEETLDVMGDVFDDELTNLDASPTDADDTYKACSQFLEKIEDDLDIKSYKARVKLWVEVRSKQRSKPVKNELFAPHPVYPDHTINASTKIPGEIYKDLFNYQKIGVEWFCGLFKNFQGGILADEMGLGKTVQAIAFLATLYYNKKLPKPSIVIAPATLTQQWVQELHRWWPPLRVINLHALKVNNNAGLARLQRKDTRRKQNLATSTKAHHMSNLVEPHFGSSTVFIASYEGALSYGTKFAKKDWGCVILDEGHKISNPDTKIAKFCKFFKTHYRYILSGTPIQNKLKELWSIYDFIRPGLLGTMVEFETTIARSIELSGSSGNDAIQSQLAVASAETLREKIKDNLLRRVKADVALELPTKHERAVLCKLTGYQYQEYCSYIESMEVRKRTNTMADIVNLRKLSNHPDIHLDKYGTSIPDYGDYTKAGKTRVLNGLLQLWHNQNHRVLIFTQGIKVQKLISQMPFFKGKKLLVMSGSTPVKERLQLVERFNTDSKVFAFLLTTRTGGQGLNLTGANKVVIFDPDWNPSADLQALSRVWRIGQCREVEILRLLSKGTLEERVHHLQLYKQILSDRILSNPDQKTMFRNHWTEIFSRPSLEDVLQPDLDQPEYTFEESAANPRPRVRVDVAQLDPNDANHNSYMYSLLGVGSVPASQLESKPKTVLHPILKKVVEQRFQKLQLTSKKAQQLQKNGIVQEAAFATTKATTTKGGLKPSLTKRPCLDPGLLDFKPRPGMRMDNTTKKGVSDKTSTAPTNCENSIYLTSNEVKLRPGMCLDNTAQNVANTKLNPTLFKPRPGMVMSNGNQNLIPTKPKPIKYIQAPFPPRDAFKTKFKLRHPNLKK